MTQRVDALPAGYELDRYRIERVLGDGGFGITYLAYHIRMGDAVAIKEYLPIEFAIREAKTTVLPRGGKAAENYAWGLSRFLDEAKTLAEFKDHPNIVTVRDYFEANGTAYLVMQYEQGQDFSRWLFHNPQPDQEALLNIIIPVLDGLRAVHARKYLHRDIKPSNIYIRDDGRPLLIDFGNSRLALGEYSRSLTNVHTPGYSPKEQYSTTGNQGAWTDIYAIGATMWRSISNQEPPAAGDRAEARDDDLPDPMISAMALGQQRYDARLLQAIDWAIAYLPKDRPQTVHSFQQPLLEVWHKTATPTPPQPASVKQPNHQPESAKQSVQDEPSHSVQVASQTPQPVSMNAIGGVAIGLLVLLIIVFFANQLANDHKAIPEVELEKEVLTSNNRDHHAESNQDSVIATTQQSESIINANFPFDTHMFSIPEGTFTMGCVAGRDDVAGGCADDEKPAHEVTVKAFKMSRYEVTVGQFRAFVKASAYKTTAEKRGSCYTLNGDNDWSYVDGANWQKPGFEQTDQHPVTCISWEDAQAFIQWLNTSDNIKADDPNRYRLPSEAEWEYAARGGNNEQAYPWGQKASHDDANYYGKSQKDQWDYTAPIGQFDANGFGLHDMHGNVWEWQEDRWHGSYADAPEDGSAWITGSSAYRVLRGGYWNNSPRNLRSANRNWGDPASRNGRIGFRLARSE